MFWLLQFANSSGNSRVGNWNTCVQNWLSTNRPSFAAANEVVTLTRRVKANSHRHARHDKAVLSVSRPLRRRELDSRQLETVADRKFEVWTRQIRSGQFSSVRVPWTNISDTHFFLRYINELLLHKITTLTFTGTQMLGGRGVKPRLANDGAAPGTWHWRQRDVDSVRLTVLYGWSFHQQSLE